VPNNSFGDLFIITTWGESHGKALGVTIDGSPPNIPITEDEINFELSLRKPGTSKFVTPRKEPDKVEILSGVFEGKTTGTPISLIIYNSDVKSQHYEDIKDIFRPGHADWTYMKKFKIRDWRGGGRASARETVARVAAGAVAQKILDKYGIKIFSYTLEYAGIRAREIDLDYAPKDKFFFPDKKNSDKLEFIADELLTLGDSAGGIVETIIQNLPAGIGEPVFDKLEAYISHAVMSIGATKGIEFGTGFEAAKMRGSSNNDQISSKGFLSNNSGGILGGISTGQNVVFRTAIKPIPSIYKKQKSINIKSEDVEIQILGRHDISAIPRINPVITAMTRVAIVDMMLRNKRLLE